jgi:hypothetical protein
MESLLARYLDGDLEVDEAAKLLDLTRNDASFEAKLRAYERLLSTCTALPADTVGPGFRESVMRRLRGTQVSPSPPRQGTSNSSAELGRAKRSWERRLLAVAASIAIVFAAGYFSARLTMSHKVMPSLGNSTRAPESTVSWNWEVTDIEGRRFVRIVHVPSIPDVQRVSVAGSFNGWDPTSVPMHLEGSVWSVVLVLPPGTYEYMFVEDGSRWVTDPLAPMTRDDGFGGRNAVLDLSL